MSSLEISRPSIVVVGPCASGKSTLVRGLVGHGYDARVCAQEHSGVAALWRHQGRPLLIGLTAELESIRLRRDGRWSRTIYLAQLGRLADAYAHADLMLATDERSSRDVLTAALQYLERGISPSSARSEWSADS